MAVRGGSCGGAGSYWGFVFVSYVRLKAVKCITKIYIKEEGVIYKVDKKIFFKHRSSSDGDWQQNTANIFQHVKERARPEELRITECLGYLFLLAFHLHLSSIL
jgi:hypothetical protein